MGSKIISQPELESEVVTFLPELGIFSSGQEDGAKSKDQVGSCTVLNLGDELETSVVKIDHRSDPRREVEDTEGILLGGAQEKIVLEGIRSREDLS